ncbi:MAG: GGDEF domain-containing protein, partial [Epsilonproteobacteria bacterium]|nr:GGDEF domain-containing protein [Campylobacterota bacterium]
MKTKTKILLSMTFIFFLLGFTNIINIFFNFKHTIVSNAFEKSELVANIVKDGLTAHMVNNTMPKRKYFLDQISKNNEIKSLWIIRGDNVKKQYGDGFIDENIQDKIDETVLKNGKTQQILTENINEMILRVTIPYIATHKNESIDCLSCHNVQEGDTLGAISMEFDISKLRTNGAVTLLKIISINLIFVTLILLLINYYISPFTRLL